MPKITAPTLGQHRTEVTERLLAAFGELIMKQGYADVSLADVAAAAGLARTAIYTYFPDREALLFAWTEREVKRTLQVLESEVAEQETFAAKLTIFIRHQLQEFASRHLPPGREVIQFLNPETYGRFMDHIEPLEHLLEGIITEGIKSKEFADIDISSTVALVMACIGAERVPLSTGAKETDEALSEVSSFVLRALGSKSD